MQRFDVRDQITYIKSLRAITDPDVTTNFKLADAGRSSYSDIRTAAR